MRKERPTDHVSTNHIGGTSSGGLECVSLNSTSRPSLSKLRAQRGEVDYRHAYVTVRTLQPIIDRSRIRASRADEAF